MKLNFFSQQTMPKQNGGRAGLPRVSFNKAGVITINHKATEIMDIKAGDKVTLAQDEDRPQDWYLFKDPKHGFEVRSGYDKKGVLFNHSEMVKSIVESLGLDTELSHGFAVAKTPTTMNGDKTKYWPLLTSN